MSGSLAVEKEAVGKEWRKDSELSSYGLKTHEERSWKGALTQHKLDQKQHLMADYTNSMCIIKTVNNKQANAISSTARRLILVHTTH